MLAGWDFFRYSFVAPTAKELPRSYKFPGITSSPCNSCSLDSASNVGNGWEWSLYGNSQKASKSSTSQSWLELGFLPHSFLSLRCLSTCQQNTLESIKREQEIILGHVTCRDSRFSQKISYDSILIELHIAIYCQCSP